MKDETNQEDAQNVLESEEREGGGRRMEWVQQQVEAEVVLIMDVNIEV